MPERSRSSRIDAVVTRLEQSLESLVGKLGDFDEKDGLYTAIRELSDSAAGLGNTDLKADREMPELLARLLHIGGRLVKIDSALASATRRIDLTRQAVAEAKTAVAPKLPIATGLVVYLLETTTQSATEEDLPSSTTPAPSTDSPRSGEVED